MFNPLERPLSFPKSWVEREKTAGPQILIPVDRKLVGR